MTNNNQVAVKGAELVKREPEQEQALLRVLMDTFYPGASPETAYMVLRACDAQGLDPMTKPFHIVPIYVKDRGMVDVVMPGIDLYRIKAHRTGNYAGMAETRWGPDITAKVGALELTYPEWCEITVYRLLNGNKTEFTAREYWLENYATKSRNDQSPNDMWKRRVRAQLAKCTEAQALRRAFPEAVGAQPTYEEMEGKSIPPDTIEVDTQTGEVTIGGKAKQVEPGSDEALAAALEAQPTEGQLMTAVGFGKDMGTADNRTDLLAVGKKVAEALAAGQLIDSQSADLKQQMQSKSTTLQLARAQELEGFLNASNSLEALNATMEDAVESMKAKDITQTMLNDLIEKHAVRKGEMKAAAE